MAIIKPNNNTLSAITSLPAGVGGKVLQVITATDSTKRETSSTSYVTASNTLSIDITPSSTSSKILIMIDQKSAKASGNTGVKLRLNRGFNEANVLSAFQVVGGETQEGTRNDFGTSSFFYLDSPNTTSAVTYVTSLANHVSGTGSARVNSSNDVSSMVLMEISV